MGLVEISWSLVWADLRGLLLRFGNMGISLRLPKCTQDLETTTKMERRFPHEQIYDYKSAVAGMWHLLLPVQTCNSKQRCQPTLAMNLISQSLARRTQQAHICGHLPSLPAER